MPLADSRLADPYDLDCPPLPPDDPASHEFMHCVDGKRGWSHWHDNGDAPAVDAELWLNSLPRDERGEVVLNMHDAVRVARKHSRDYQTELEDLYLSALDVTFERFRFDTQFFLTNETTGTFDGPTRTGSGDRSTLDVTTDGRLRKLSATGGELVVGLANSLMWDLSGRDTDSISSTLDFTLVQPLMRFGGRARVLERLTQSERTLLANVRQMEQFRRGFYVETISGRSGGDGPLRQGNVGANGLGVLAGSASGRSGTISVSGYIGLLQEQQVIRNRENNLTALRNATIQLEAFFDAGRMPKLQVDQTRQAYLNSLSSLVVSKAAYASRVDAYKLQLGLPPRLPLQIRDPLIDRLQLIDPELTDLQDDLADSIEVARQFTKPAADIDLPKNRSDVLKLRPRIEKLVDKIHAEFAVLEPAISARVVELQSLQPLVTELKLNVDPAIFSTDQLLARISDLRQRLPKLQNDLAAVFTLLGERSDQQLTEKPEESRNELVEIETELSGLLSDAMLLQAATRLEQVRLVPVQVDEGAAMQTARGHRLDWMNARANLVDAWRQIEVEANALQSGLNVVVSGDLGTRGDNPVEFHSDNGRLRVGVEFDTPLTRLVERNRYREAQIEYQRARRDYMQFEDEISQSVRNTLRVVDLTKINFEVRRMAVLVAISQVGFTRMRLNQPPQAGAAAQLSPTTARDLVSALNDLLDSQNDFLNAWVSFEVLRMLLDFELGTMQLNSEGLWIDPGSITLTSESPDGNGPARPPAEFPPPPAPTAQSGQDVKADSTKPSASVKQTGA